MSRTQVKEKIQLDIALVAPVLLTNQCQTVYLRIGLTGCYLQTKKEPLVPVNMALVVDTSNSMQGEKIEQAKEAAIMIVKRLRSTDLITIVAFDHQSRVLLPTTRIQNREMIVQLIQTLGGNEQTSLFYSSALFDGLEKGTKEILKYRRPYQINRMILLSDGLANVGPHSVSEMGEFGRVLGEKNVAITTIGFGEHYNRELMMPLSQHSEGHHAVVKNTTDIIDIFEQAFTEMALMVAQKIKVTLNCNENVRLIRVLGRTAKIEGQTVLVQLNQLYSGLEKYILVELEMPPNQRQALADLIIAYHNLKTSRRQRLKKKITLNKSLMIHC